MSALMTSTEVVAIAFTRSVSEDKIESTLIESVQLKHIMPIIGEDLFDAIVEDASGYTDLLAEIKNVLAYYVAYYTMPRLYSEIGTTGVYLFDSSQGKRRVDREDYQNLREDILEKAHMLATQMTKFLDDNQDDYSLYNKGQNPEETISFAGGIIMKHKVREYDDDPYYPDRKF